MILLMIFPESGASKHDQEHEHDRRRSDGGYGLIS